MANDVSANPWKLNTTTTSTIWPSEVKITSVTWANYSLGSAQSLILQDANGKDIVNMAVPSTQTQVIPLSQTNIGWVRGLIVNALSSGEVTVSIGAGK